VSSAVVIRGVRAVLEDGMRAVDIAIEGERIATSDTHGTGCVLSAALTARLALGDDLPDAARAAKAVVSRALRCAVALGAGPGSVDPLGL